MSQRYILPVEEDEHGDLFITLPDALLDEAGWDYGDTLEYDVQDDSVILRKINE
jgi:antitoxin component of MazEF toxin-antitoxin module|tara:strand:+ start:3825 stop:3986 length:162 start_codon:yes stop_codon:yes gene_type:complete